MRVVVEFLPQIGRQPLVIDHEDERWNEPIVAAFDPSQLNVAPGVFVAGAAVAVIRYET